MLSNLRALDTELLHKILIIKAISSPVDRDTTKASEKCSKENKKRREVLQRISTRSVAFSTELFKFFFPKLVPKETGVPIEG